MPAALMLLEPAVQYVGVHAMLPGQGGNGNAGLPTSGHQFGLGHIDPDKHLKLLHGSLLGERMTSVGVEIPASRVGLLKDRRYWVALSSLSTLEGGVGAISASRSVPIAGSSGPPPQHLKHTSRFCGMCWMALVLRTLRLC